MGPALAATNMFRRQVELPICVDEFGVYEANSATWMVEVRHCEGFPRDGIGGEFVTCNILLQSSAATVDAPQNFHLAICILALSLPSEACGSKLLRPCENRVRAMSGELGLLRPELVAGTLLRCFPGCVGEGSWFEGLAVWVGPSPEIIVRVPACCLAFLTRMAS